jgi:hypothetical protein
MSLTDKIETTRRTMTLFFVIDTPGSMEGSKIEAVNAAIDEVIPTLQGVSGENADAQMKNPGASSWVLRWRGNLLYWRGPYPNAKIV